MHVLTSAGDRTVSLGNGLFAQALFPILGTNPPKPAAIPPLRADVACETQEPPDLRTKAGPGDPEVAQGLPKTAAARKRQARAQRTAVQWVKGLVKRQGLQGKLRVEDGR